MRVGFLLDHRSDQAWHVLPIAFELSRRYSDLDVVIVVADARLHAIARELGDLYPGHTCRVVTAWMPPGIRVAETLLGAWTPVRKKAALRYNRELYASFDALVAPDVTSVRIRRRHGLPCLPMVLTRHGAGDREGSFPAAIADFDLVLLPGSKTEQDLKRRNLITEGRYQRIGYPKFSAVDRLPEPSSPFDNDRPTVLYNPHFDPDVSSWHVWGRSILEFFRRNAAHYNLIFAPHIKLFSRWLRYGARLPRRYTQCPNIIIDRGSRALADMTYTRLADIYLGDVSSQVYEFIRRPRPCLFLNPADVAWEGDPRYRHWQLGDVVSSLEALPTALERHIQDPGRYTERQRRAWRETFDDEGTDPAQRAATAIHEWLQRRAS